MNNLSSSLLNFAFGSGIWIALILLTWLIGKNLSTRKELDQMKLPPALDKDNGWSQTIGGITIFAHIGILYGVILWIQTDLNVAIPWLTISGIVNILSIFAQYLVYWRRLDRFVPPGVEFTLTGSIFLMISSWLVIPNNRLSYVIGITLLGFGMIRFTYIYWHESQKDRGF